MKNRQCVSATIVLSLFLNVASASRAHADSVCDRGSPAGWFFFSTDSDPYPDYCNLHIAPVIDTVSVWAYAVPFQKARVTVPDPPFGSVVGEHWLFPHTGDRQSGLELDAGGCTSVETVKLGELYLFVSPDTDPAVCASWTEGTAEIQNCAGVWLPAKYIPQRAATTSPCICPGWQSCYSLPPTDLFPADGARDVPTNVVLTWVAPEGWDQVNSGCGVYISTDSTCASVQTFVVPCNNDSFAPDFLQPGVKYYWRSSWATDSMWGCYGWSAFQSFTTARLSPVRASTWGQVKAMYRR